MNVKYFKIMSKDFNTWNTRKKIINDSFSDRKVYYNEKDVWWGNLGLNIGVETDGKPEDFERPVLIIKKFNAEMVWVLPITSSIRVDRYHHQLQHNTIKGTVILSQLRTISTKRLSRKFGMLSREDFNNILLKIVSFLKIKSPLAGAFSEAEATNE